VDINSFLTSLKSFSTHQPCAQNSLPQGMHGFRLISLLCPGFGVGKIWSHPWDFASSYGTYLLVASICSSTIAGRPLLAILLNISYSKSLDSFISFSLLPYSVCFLRSCKVIVGKLLLLDFVSFRALSLFIRYYI
jgi:hypothetical protein